MFVNYAIVCSQKFKKMAQVKKRFEICAGKKYTNSANETKSEWYKCGKMTVWDDGGISIEMLTIPTWDGFDNRYSAFEVKPKEAEQTPVATTAPQQQYNKHNTEEPLPF